MTTSKFREGQIWLAYVHFAEKPKVGKVRPVVILHAEDKLKVSACRVTSRPLTDSTDVFIKEWESCGLVKPSCIRADIIFELPISDVLSEKPFGVVRKKTLSEVFTKIKENKAGEE